MVRLKTVKDMKGKKMPEINLDALNEKKFVINVSKEMLDELLCIKRLSVSYIVDGSPVTFVLKLHD